MSVNSERKLLGSTWSPSPVSSSSEWTCDCYKRLQLKKSLHYKQTAPALQQCDLWFDRWCVTHTGTALFRNKPRPHDGVVQWRMVCCPMWNHRTKQQVYLLLLLHHAVTVSLLYNRGNIFQTRNYSFIYFNDKIKIEWMGEKGKAFWIVHKT